MKKFLVISFIYGFVFCFLVYFVYSATVFHVNVNFNDNECVFMPTKQNKDIVTLYSNNWVGIDIYHKKSLFSQYYFHYQEGSTEVQVTDDFTILLNFDGEIPTVKMVGAFHDKVYSLKLPEREENFDLMIYHYERYNGSLNLEFSRKSWTLFTGVNETELHIADGVQDYALNIDGFNLEISYDDSIVHEEDLFHYVELSIQNEDYISEHMIRVVYL